MIKAVKVESTVKPEFVEQNRINIQRVMDKLKQNPIPGMMYSSYIKDDGQTFVHINIAKDGETLSLLNEMDEFTHFRKALKESEPLQLPHSTRLNPVAAGFEI